MYTQLTHLARKPVAAMQAGDASPGSEDIPMPTHRPTGAQMHFQQRPIIPVSAQQVSDGDKSLPARLSRAIGVHIEPSMGQVDQMPSTDLTSCDTQSRPLPPGMELQSQLVIHSVRNAMNFAHRLSLHACLVPLAPTSRFCRHMLNRSITPT